MKKLLTVVCFFMATAAFAAGNKMSMVTYFPVPYVAYSQVNVAQQMDIGLTDTCNMNLGCTEPSVNLKANTVNLKGGRLDLDGGRGVLGNSVTLGTNVVGNGQIKFKDVRIQDGNMQSLNAKDMRVSTLKLFGHDFPPCAGKGDSDGMMSWQPLSLQGASQGQEELYLVCGKPEDNRCKPTHNGQETYTDEYGYVLVWDYNDCEYKEEDLPPVGKKRCLSAMKNCEWTAVSCGQLNGPSSCGGGYNDSSYPSCQNMTVNQAIEFSICQRKYPSVFNKYEILDWRILGGEDSSCKLNGECNSCQLGKKYITDQIQYKTPQGYITWLYHTSCRSGDNVESLFLAQYATCYEVDENEDCKVENHDNCWTHEHYTGISTGGGLEPVNPNWSATM